MKKTKRYYVVIFDRKWLEGLLGSEHDELVEAQKALNEAKEMGGIYDVKEGRFVQLKETSPQPSPFAKAANGEGKKEIEQEEKENDG